MGYYWLCCVNGVSYIGLIILILGLQKRASRRTAWLADLENTTRSPRAKQKETEK